MTFARLMLGRMPSAALARLAASNPQTDDPRAALEAGFAELLTYYLAESRSLTAWDCDCLANATRLLCLELYGQAIEQIAQIRCPPEPLPTLRVSESPTVEELAAFNIRLRRVTPKND